MQNRSRKQFATVDMSTKKIYPGIMVYIPPRRKMGEDFTMLLQEGVMYLAADRTLSKAALRVLLYCFGTLYYENELAFRQKTVAEHIGIQSSRVSLAIKELVEKEILIPIEDKPKGCFYLNPFYGWRGKSHKRNVSELNQYRLNTIDKLRTAH